MLVGAIDIQASLIGIAAFITAIGGVASTIMALRKSNSEDHQQCIENLKACREESEKLAAELHKLRMERESE